MPLPPWLDRLLLQPRCPRCQRPSPRRALCISCRRNLGLEADGLRGQCPMPWWALGSYADGWRSQLLQLRRQPNPWLVEALGRQLLQQLPDLGVPLLVTAIPARRPGGNPLPLQLAQVLSRLGGHQLLPALGRQRACLGQHHLNKAQRKANLQGVFICTRPAGPRLQPLLLVDDILTSGATAVAAMAALEAGGHGLLGMACFARTPAKRRQSG